ncbi:YadA-like family protein [Haemophilus parainfluenzae]|uniref:YadA-like family protein n=1 Tax=Haemophilus parainfluenzae TaxID=729 RepID=UPI0018A68032|nr:YadA-like family protein [Haemophilus parainfluenzae]QOR14929.1 YadA-like family protein [Haemophilus parainfluenzae]QOR18854.1 YadA-like family protein [Haemophilus parainfluenzae]
MKNFKFNAITALIIGVNVAVANAVTTTPNPNVDYSGSSAFTNSADDTNVESPSHTTIGQDNHVYSIAAPQDQGSSSAFGNQNLVKGQHANAFGDGNDAYGKQTQSFGDANKIYADSSVGFGANNIAGKYNNETPKETRTADANTESVAIFGLNNNVVGKNILAVGKDNKVTDDTTTNATVIGFNATASSANATAIGTAASALANETIAIGQAAKASGQNSNAYGSQANASGTSSLAVGTGSVASGDSAVAIGNDSTVTGGSAVAIGASATSTGKWSTALGDSANAKGEKSVALSKDSYAKDDNSVALGSGTITRSATNVTTATVNGITYSGFAGNSNNIAVVSVGSDKTETYTPPDHSTPGRTVTITPHTRQIINVSAGEISATSTDAINGSQLYMVADQVGKNKTRIDNIRVRTSDVKVKAGDNINVEEAYDDANQVKTYTVSTAKDIKADSYTVNNSSVQINQNGINAGDKNITNVADPKAPTDAANKRYVDNKVNKVDRKTRAGIAGVAAIASAPSARKDGKSMVSTGVAHHRGESAIAIKASRNSDNGHWSTNVNGAADTRGQFTVGAGVGYEW